MKAIVFGMFIQLVLITSCFSQQENNSGTPVRVAVVQQNGNPGKVEENRMKALGFAREALKKGADVILFHEELLTGYTKDVKKLAESVDGPTTRAFQELLKGTSSVIVYGLTEKDDEKYYISSVVVSGGGIVAHYRKTHLWHEKGTLRDEPAVYTPGNALKTFKVKGYLCGLMICYDGDFPETTSSYANMGCSMVFWMNNRRSRGNAEVKDLARKNTMIMPVSCNTGIDELGNFCPGGSNITGPGGEVIAEIWDKEGVIISDVYPGKIPELRKNNSYFMHRRNDLYYYK